MAADGVEGSVYRAVRPLLWRIDPERAHRLANLGLRRMHRGTRAPRPVDSRLATEVAGVRFASPIGIAAGFDKEAEVYNALLRLGFSHVEVGTVTPRPQPGNDGRRIARATRQRGLVNRLGFPGPGMDKVAERIADVPPVGPIGINIGPNKETAADDVPRAIRGLAETLAPYASYLCVNVSSPNTPGLRALQTPAGAAALVAAAIDGRDKVRSAVPVFLKLHPDAADDELVDVASAAVDAGAAGIVAVNTTVHHPRGFPKMEGGASGRPLTERARRVIGTLYHGLGRDTPIIGVGGVMDGRDAWKHMQAGASAVQTYTGFIYEGPGLARTLHADLLRRLDRVGADSVQDIIGSA